MSAELADWMRARLDSRAEDSKAAQKVATNGDLLGLIDFTFADIDAKRRILNEHEPDRHGYCPTCNDNTVEAPCFTVRLLALPYASFPGYRQEWAP